MRVPSIILPIVVAFAIGGAFFAGRYIGGYDADKRHVIAMKTEYAAQSADKLRILSATTELLRASKVAEAIRLADQFASLQVPTITECLSSASCASWIAPTAESRETLIRRVAEHGSTSAATPTR